MSLRFFFVKTQVIQEKEQRNLIFIVIKNNAKITQSREPSGIVLLNFFILNNFIPNILNTHLVSDKSLQFHPSACGQIGRAHV